ncbi:MAG: hypothetical protein ACE5JZ_11355 [Kiloniellales bacterium]
MSDKPPAALIAAVIGAPLMVVCCVFGPAVIAWVVAWASGWVAGLGVAASTGLAIVAAMVVYGLARRRRAKTAPSRGVGRRTEMVSDRS